MGDHEVAAAGRRVAAIIAALLACALLVACGTILAIDPDGPAVNGDGGNDATLLDGPEISVDFDGGGDDASTACSLSVDRSTLAMGEVIAGSSHTETVNIGNVTDTAANVAITVTGAGFSVNGAATTAMVLVPPATPKTPFQVTYSASNTPGPQTGSLTLTWLGGCQVAIPLSGTSVPFGSVAVSPATLDLGAVTCGTAPSPATLHVTTSMAGKTWTGAIVPAGTPFSVDPSGTLLAGESLIPVSASALVPAAEPKRFDAVVQLTIAGDARRDIAVTALSLGAKLDFLPSNDVTLTKTSSSRTVGLQNNGTQTVQVSLAIDAPFAITPNKVTVLPGKTQAVTVSTAATAGGTVVTQTAKMVALAGTICSAQTLTVHY